MSALIGHASIRALLARAASTPASAYGFFGPEHVGKRRVAEEFIRQIMTLPPELSLTTHPDILTLDAREETKVEALKVFLERVHQTAAYGGRRVFLIDHADELTLAGMNALLKDVEEPKSGVTFILIASRMEAVPATLRSRLIPIRFSTLSVPDMEMMASMLGVARTWAAASLGRPGLLVRRQEDEAWWGRLEQYAQRLTHALCGNEIAPLIAVIDDWQKAIEKLPTAEQDWRILLLLLMQSWAGTPELGSGIALTEAWRLLGSAVPARVGMELAFLQKHELEKRAILSSI